MPTLQRLFDPVNQFELRNGQLNVAGKLYVYLNGTDDLANIYGNNMEQLAQPVILDADGRAPGLFVDSAHMYWIKVCGRGGNEQYSVKDMVPIGSGSGGSGADVEVISTDGTVKVDPSFDGGVKTFDLSVAEDSTECLEWFDGGVQGLSSGDVYPTLEAGTMEVEAERGLRVFQDRLYHVTSSFTVNPTGIGVNYGTLEVSLMYAGSGSPVAIMTRTYDIDNSVTDNVDIGFGCDVMAPGDGVLYWHVGGAENFARVDGRMQVHRVYSGVAAVPGTVATKTWVEGNFQQKSGMSSYVGYSAISGSGGMVTAINGSAIYGTDSATVSAIASAYAGSAASGKMDSSGMSAYVPFSAIGGASGQISAINGSSLSGAGKTYSGIWPVVVDNSADTVSVDHLPLCTDSTITAYMSGGSAVLGVVPSSIDMSGYAKESALSAKLDASASGDFMLASGMTAYQQSGDYAYNSALSSKFDASASGAFYPSGNPSGFLTSAYSPTFDYNSANQITAIDGSAVGGMDEGAVSSIASAYAESAASGKMDASGMSAYQPSGDYAYNSALSAKFDASASGAFYPSGNPSGFLTSAYSPTFDYNSANQITAIDGSAVGGMDDGAVSAIASAYAESAASGKMDASGMSAYQLSGDYAFNSALSSKLDASASGDFMLSSGMTAYQLSGDYAYNSALSSKMDASGMSAYQEKSGMSAYQLSGDYAYNSALSAKFDASASSNFYPSSNPSGFISSADKSAFDYSSMGTITVIGRNLESTDSARLVMEETASGIQWMDRWHGTTIDFNQLYFTAGNSASIYLQSQYPTANIRAVEFLDQSSIRILETGVEASSVSMALPSGTRYMTVSGESYNGEQFGFTAKNVVPGTVVPLAHRSALSAKMDKSASSNFMMSSGMTAYQLSGDYAYNSALSSKFDASASGAFYPSGNPSGFLTSAYTPSFDYNSANQITAIDGSAVGGMDEGAVSAIASAYAESAASGKMDSSASSDFMFASGMSAYQLSGDYAYNSALSSKFDASASGAFYPSGNPSGFLTAQAQASWTESASASPSYIQDKPDLVDIVAGPGIVVDNPDGNTLRVSVAQELATELWSGDSGQITSATDASLPLAEAAEHFEYLLVYVSGSAMSGGIVVLRFHPTGDNTSFYPLTVSYTNDGGTIFTDSCVVRIAGSSFYIKSGMRTGINASGTVIAATNRGPIIKKIVGINRISS